jgi:hypothetical protein
MRDTTFQDPNNPQLLVKQKMYVEGSNDQKGIETILKERGLWESLVNKQLTCHDCRDGHPVPNVTHCCAKRCLSEQPDFKNQKEWLREVIEDYFGYSIIFFPKFHCELNYIEMVWGYLKRKLRSECKFSFEHLQQRVPEILTSEEELPLSFIQRASRHCQRFMEGYRIGLHGPLLDYAMKKYRGHRTIAADQLVIIQEEFNKIQAIKRERQLRS